MGGRERKLQKNYLYYDDFSLFIHASAIFLFSHFGEFLLQRNLEAPLLTFISLFVSRHEVPVSSEKIRLLVMTTSLLSQTCTALGLDKVLEGLDVALDPLVRVKLYAICKD